MFAIFLENRCWALFLDLERLIVFDGEVLDAFGNHTFDAFSCLDAFAYLRAADVEQWGFYDGNTGRHFAHAGALAGIDYNRVVGKNIVVVIPFVECCPVVAAY